MGVLLKFVGFFLVTHYAGWQTAVAILMMELGHQIDGHAQHADKKLESSPYWWGKQYVEKGEKQPPTAHEPRITTYSR